MKTSLRKLLAGSLTASEIFMGVAYGTGLGFIANGCENIEAGRETVAAVDARVDEICPDRDPLLRTCISENLNHASDVRKNAEFRQVFGNVQQGAGGLILLVAGAALVTSGIRRSVRARRR